MAVRPKIAITFLVSLYFAFQESFKPSLASHLTCNYRSVDVFSKHRIRAGQASERPVALVCVLAFVEVTVLDMK